MKLSCKRILSILLCAVLLTGLLPATAFAATTVASGTCGENLTWKLDQDGVLTISGTGKMDNYDLISTVLPETPEGLEGLNYPHWCLYRYTIRKVVIEEGITSVGSYAFYNVYPYITEVTLPDTLEKIYRCAFHSCPITSIEIPYGVTYIGYMAFSSTELISVIVPDSVTEFDQYVFAHCAKLQSVKLSERLTSIPAYTFLNCTALAELDIPDSVTSIEFRAFDGCDLLKTLTIPASVVKMGNKVFYTGATKKINFLGDAPTFSSETFVSNIMTVYYPANNATWTEDIMQDYGGTVTWIAYTPYKILDESRTSFTANKDHDITLITDGDVSTVSEVLMDDMTVDSANYELSTADHSIIFSEAYLKSLPVGTHRVTVQFQDGFATCFITLYPAHSHGYAVTESADATCTEQGYTVYTCSGCGESYTEYTNALDHSWLDATCTEPMTCTRCGATSGEEKGHHWTAATCTTPKMCSACGITEGSSLGHDWHDATCTSPMYCSVCGLTSGNPLGHNYADGICTRCEETDPDYQEPTEPDEPDVPTQPTDPAEPEQPTLDGVCRIAGAGRVETSLAIAESFKAQLGVEKFTNVVVASALNFPDALAGSYLAAKVDAPILLTYPGAQAQVMAYIHGSLQSGGTVYILGGESAVSANFANMLSASGIKCERVAGSDRFGTNLAILNQAGVSAGQDILVCTAFGFADSLSVSATGMPILLVGQSLNQQQEDFLNRCGGGKIWIIGGYGAVSAPVENQLKQYASEIRRLAGAGRHETSVLVADSFFHDAKSAVIAYSMNFPDGLCGGPLAYALGAPLILTNSADTCVNAFTDPRDITAGFVLGGSSLVSDIAVRRIFHLSAGTAIPTK